MESRVSRWQWAISIVSLGLLFVLMALPKAWSLSLSDTHRSEYPSDYTTVSQIQRNQLGNTGIYPATTSGQVGVEAIKSLNYRPAKSSAHSQSPKIQPVKETPVSVLPAKVAPVLSMPTTTSAVLVFPVLSYRTSNKAFADLPVMLSSAVASKLAHQLQAQNTGWKVLNPIYTYDDIKDRGLDGLYQRLVRDYLEAGQPNESDLTYLTQQLSTPSQQIGCVAFVEANFDVNTITKPTGLQIPMDLLFDRTPQNPNYRVEGVIHVFSTHNGAPLLWQGSASHHLKLTAFDNFTRSVYDEPDSTARFQAATHSMAGNLASGLLTALASYQLQVQGKVLPQSQPVAETPLNLSTSDQEAFKRILNY